jgi:mono/diheme cytochrome c family protein
VTILVTALTAALLLGFRPRKPAGLAIDRFEHARYVAEFSVKDTRGRVVTPREWRSHRAVVLLAVAPDDLGSIVSTLRDLNASYGPRDVGIYALTYGPGEISSGLSAFPDDPPILVDPSHEIIEAAGIVATPTAVVLDPEGLVLYRGDLEGARDAIDATLKGRLPDVAERPVIGQSVPEPAPLIAQGETVTYAGQIAPILRAHCVECHRPGEVGPFSLLTYRDAAKRAHLLSDVAATRQMPPWKAQPGFGEFLDAHRLTRRELALLDRWAETGAPEGDPVGLAPAQDFAEGWKLGTPDLVLTMPEPYAVPATGDDWRGFVLPGRLTDGRAIATVEFRPGNRKVVHHARVFVDESPDCRTLDDEAPGQGFPYDGRADIPKPSLCEWAPGMVPRMPPDGVAKPIKPGSDVVVLLHYHGSGKPETDRSSVAIYFARTPPRRIMALHPLASNRIDIPAGESRYREVAATTIRHDVHVFSLFPHGHNLLREMMLTATLPDGQVRRLLWIKDWDFGWQTQYHFAEPVALPRGTRVEVVATYDNSSANPRNPNSPPIRVRFGPGSNEEMLGCHLYVVADYDEGDESYRRIWASGR